MSYTSVIDAPRVQKAAARVEGERGALLFSGALFACAMLCQRFGHEFTSTFLDSVTPLGMGLALLFVLQGTLILNRQRLLIFGVCAFWHSSERSSGRSFPMSWVARRASTPWVSSCC